MTEKKHSENLFCPLKQQETRHETWRKRKYYFGRCDGQKCGWWHEQTKGCSIRALTHIVEMMESLR